MPSACPLLKRSWDGVVPSVTAEHCCPTLARGASSRGRTPTTVGEVGVWRGPSLESGRAVSRSSPSKSAHSLMRARQWRSTCYAPTSSGFRRGRSGNLLVAEQDADVLDGTPRASSVTTRPHLMMTSPAQSQGGCVTACSRPPRRRLALGQRHRHRIRPHEESPPVDLTAAARWPPHTVRRHPHHSRPRLPHPRTRAQRGTRHYASSRPSGPDTSRY